MLGFSLMGRTARQALMNRASSSNRPNTNCNSRLALEVLEERWLPSWIGLGPSPQLDPLNKLGTGFPATGRVTALAIDSDFDGLGHDAIALGTAK